MKKFFTVLLTLAMVFSFASVAFAADYNWGKEPVPCEEYTIDITKYEMVVENGKSKLIESANVAAKKGDTVYFSVNVYNKDKNEELILVFNGQDFHITNLEDVVIKNSTINIEAFAFYGCIGIKKLTMPVSVEISTKNTFG